MPYHFVAELLHNNRAVPMPVAMRVISFLPKRWDLSYRPEYNPEDPHEYFNAHEVPQHMCPGET